MAAHSVAKNGPPQDPGEDPGDVEIPEYGDLIRLLRDEANGAPILTEDQCLWPLASPECIADSTLNALCVSSLETGYDVINPDLIEPEFCSITIEICAGCTMEADFGRTRQA